MVITICQLVLNDSASQDTGLERSLEEVTQEHILDALATHQNNTSQSALSLGIEGKTLREKVKKYRAEDAKPDAR